MRIYFLFFVELAFPGKLFNLQIPYLQKKKNNNKMDSLLKNIIK